MNTAMKVVRREGAWWITGVPPYKANDETFDSYGPYRTRAEAEDDMRGVAKTLKQIDK